MPKYEAYKKVFYNILHILLDKNTNILQNVIELEGVTPF